ncbi:hypothetical protein PROFUN_08415 [Planoprotostelium fungivorum]|uniref:Uncharacterized protein n=1 Tax=Planoprotostelium fungivorum TaxID=1890364 RepID=A0A2P6NJS7_9EUKA|nr:hypothetical protein PROFUN_08415 [Planoprotostelium fungivorum]
MPNLIHTPLKHKRLGRSATHKTNGVQLEQLPRDIFCYISHYLTPRDNCGSDATHTITDLNDLFNLTIRPIYQQFMLSTIVLPSTLNGINTNLFKEPFYTALTHTIIIHPTTKKYKHARLIQSILKELPLINLRRVVIHTTASEFPNYKWLGRRNLEQVVVTIDRPVRSSKHRVIQTLLPFVTPSLKKFKLVDELDPISKDFRLNFAFFAGQLSRHCHDITSVSISIGHHLFNRYFSYARLEEFHIYSGSDQTTPMSFLERYPTIEKLIDQSRCAHRAFKLSTGGNMLPHLREVYTSNLNLHHYLEPIAMTKRSRPLEHVCVTFVSPAEDHLWLRQLPPSMRKLTVVTRQVIHPPSGLPPLPLMRDLVIHYTALLKSSSLRNKNIRVTESIDWVKPWLEAMPSLRRIRVTNDDSKVVLYDVKERTGKIVNRDGNTSSRFFWLKDFRCYDGDSFSGRALQRLGHKWRISLPLAFSSDLWRMSKEEWEFRVSLL